VLCIAVLLTLPAYKIGAGLIKEKSFTYTGYEEAGRWIQHNVPEDAIIITNSDREMRFHTKREYLRHGGTIKKLPHELQYFLNLTKQYDTIFLETDVWGWDQPDWLFPMTDQKMKNLEEIDFRIVHTVYKTVDDKGKVSPVVFIFKKG